MEIFAGPLEKWMIDVHLSFSARCGLMPDRCKEAECERQKEEIQNLRMEILLLQRRASTNGSVPSVSPSINARVEGMSSPVLSNVATWGSPETKKSITPEEKNTSEHTDEKGRC